MTGTERARKSRGKKQAIRLDHIAVLDTETDPFDAENNAHIFPFTACLYSDKFEPIIIWEENADAFIDALVEAIESLPGKFTIYAHNGGKFDFMFLVHRLRGAVKFKGRGIMVAKIGNHELRDSFHIIPEKLANWSKEAIDYKKMLKGRRSKHKDEIISYMVSDCRNLFEIVKQFLGEFGLKLSIGQAAMAEIRRHYNVARLGETTDEYMRNYFYGGRVECLMGKGEFNGPYKLYDVNSMYPFVMANYQHPVGGEFEFNSNGDPGPNTVFVELECQNYGAFVCRGDNNETTANLERGRFRTSIWEFEAARKHGLIDDVEIIRTIDCEARSDFSLFVNPLYERRQQTKTLIKEMRAAGVDETASEFKTAKKDDLFFKLIMNNGYGKFAQNPRRFKECYITDPGHYPDEGDDWGDLPALECEGYWIWEKPITKLRFNNVANAASITGAARAVLMDAIQRADDPIYCDTDSLICRALDCDIDETRLGAWKLEQEFESVLIAGKKLYACKVAGLPDGHKNRVKVRSKGVAGVTWADIQKILDEDLVEALRSVQKVSKGVTLTKTGQQFYMRRNIRATAPKITSRTNYHQHRARA